jgi:hypothetical protein
VDLLAEQLKDFPRAVGLLQAGHVALEGATTARWSSSGSGMGSGRRANTLLP